MNGVLIAFVLGMLDLPGADTDAAVVDRLAAYAQAGFRAPAGDPSRAAPTEP